MKTKKYFSLNALMTVVISLAFAVTVNAQFMTPNPASPNTQAMEEVRTGQTITYNVNADHVAGQLYRWAVVGGTINHASAVVSGDSSIVNWTANLSSITVTWDEDLTATPIGSYDGRVVVQKRTLDGCPSQLQATPVRLWNDPTAEIAAANTDFAICSGDAVGGTITINFTGAPDPVADGFEVVYDIAATNLTDLGGNPVAASGVSALTNGSSLTINLPDGLISTDIVNDAQFVITLSSMHDDFTGAGTLGAHSTFTITVHPTVVTGPIVSSSSLTRR
ncbi:MAG: hypothetical protein ACOYXB_05400 [Bacteroidota bacterium]